MSCYYYIPPLGAVLAPGLPRPGLDLRATLPVPRGLIPLVPRCGWAGGAAGSVAPQMMGCRVIRGRLPAVAPALPLLDEAPPDSRTGIVRPET